MPVYRCVTGSSGNPPAPGPTRRFSRGRHVRDASYRNVLDSRPRFSCQPGQQMRPWRPPHQR